MAQGHRTAGHSVLGFPTHNPTHRLTCLARLPQTLAVPVVFLFSTSDRHARGIVSALLEHGVLTSESLRAPLRLVFPAELACRSMPGLFRDVDG
jgi:hypothetical protein